MSSRQFTAVHHYVPCWYQHQFLDPKASEKKYWCLDLQPERVPKRNGGYYVRDELRRLGPVNCFQLEHLYTLRLGKLFTDHLETGFFGYIDDLGAKTIRRFEHLVENWDEADQSPGDTINDCVQYLDAQKLRTPKGLDALAGVADAKDHQQTLLAIRHFFQVNVTVWMEGVWEILDCSASPTKLLVSDHPVTTYNRAMFPQSKYCIYPGDAPITSLGTHTLYPLNPSKLLVITNLGYVRDPAADPLKRRINPRAFANTMFDIRSVQTGRQMSENEVLAANFILKSRARRYIAAPEKDWLYPEHRIPSRMWNKLGDRFFLMPDPRKVSFSTTMAIGFKDGGGFAMDEYGRRPRDDDLTVKSQREREWATFRKHQKVWDAKFGKLPAGSLRKFI